MNSLENTGRGFSAIDNFYELHRADFWGWVCVVIIFIWVIGYPMWKTWKEGKDD